MSVFEIFDKYKFLGGPGRVRTNVDNVYATKQQPCKADPPVTPFGMLDRYRITMNTISYQRSAARHRFSWTATVFLNSDDYHAKCWTPRSVLFSKKINPMFHRTGIRVNIWSLLHIDRYLCPLHSTVRGIAITMSNERKEKRPQAPEHASKLGE